MGRNTSLVDVVIDPDLSGLMRSHQKEGVKVSAIFKDDLMANPSSCIPA